MSVTDPSAGGGNTAPPEAGPGGSSPTDQEVGQNWFDGWAHAIEERLGHLETAITNVAQSQKIGASNAGSGTSQPRNTPQAGASAQGNDSATPAVSQPGQSGGAPAASQPGGDASPKPGHIYFRRLWGK